MYKIADIQEYRKDSGIKSSPSAWVNEVANVLESRYHDDEAIQQLLMLATQLTGLSNI